MIATRHWAASVKNQVLCFERASSLFERSEFDDAETKTANFWQRSRPCRDFSLILDFAHARHCSNEFGTALANRKIGSFLLVVKRNERKTNRKFYLRNYKGIYLNLPLMVCTPKFAIFSVQTKLKNMLFGIFFSLTTLSFVFTLYSLLLTLPINRIQDGCQMQAAEH